MALFTPTYINTSISQTQVQGICFDGTYIWAANYLTANGNSVVKIRASDGAYIQSNGQPGTLAQATTAVASQPWAMCSDGTYIWVACMNSQGFSKVRIADGVNVGFVGLGTWADGGNLISDGTSLWYPEGTKLYKINPATDAITTYTPGLSQNIQCVAFDGTDIWATAPYGPYVYKISRTGSLLATYTVASSPYGICFDGTYIWVVSNIASGVIVKLRASDGAYIKFDGTVGTLSQASYPTGSANSSPKMALYDGTHIWVTCTGTNELTALNRDTGGMWAMLSVAQPFGIAYDNADKIWVTNMLRVPGSVASVPIWETYRLASKASLAVGSTFNLVNPTTIQITPANIQNLFNNGDLQHDVWYKPVLSGQSDYQPPYIMASGANIVYGHEARAAQDARISITLAGRIAETSTLKEYSFVDANTVAAWTFNNTAADATGSGFSFTTASGGNVGNQFYGGTVDGTYRLQTRVTQGTRSAAAYTGYAGTTLSGNYGRFTVAFNDGDAHKTTLINTFSGDFTLEMWIGWGWAAINSFPIAYQYPTSGGLFSVGDPSISANEWFTIGHLRDTANGTLFSAWRDTAGATVSSALLTNTGYGVNSGPSFPWQCHQYRRWHDSSTGTWKWDYWLDGAVASFGSHPNAISGNTAGQLNLTVSCYHHIYTWCTSIMPSKFRLSNVRRTDTELKSYMAKE
jgi:hypothetical protein